MFLGVVRQARAGRPISLDYQDFRLSGKPAQLGPQAWIIRISGCQVGPRKQAHELGSSVFPVVRQARTGRPTSLDHQDFRLPGRPAQVGPQSGIIRISGCQVGPQVGPQVGLQAWISGFPVVRQARRQARRQAQQATNQIGKHFIQSSIFEMKASSTRICLINVHTCICSCLKLKQCIFCMMQPISFTIIKQHATRDKSTSNKKQTLMMHTQF